MEQVRVALQATDPLSLAGLMSYLESRTEVTIVRGDHRPSVDVLVVVADRLSLDVIGGLRRLVIPPSLADGPVRYGPIPPDATLVFDIELTDVQTTASQ